MSDIVWFTFLLAWFILDFSATILDIWLRLRKKL
jgi:hypothetical protein